MKTWRVVSVLALLVALWWGVSETPSPTPDSPEDPAPGAKTGEPATAIDPDENTPSTPGTILGRVLRGGEPLSATVEVRLLREFEDPDTSNREPRLLTSLGLAGRAARGPATATDRSAADGRFVIPDLPPGRYEVRAVSSDGGRGMARADLVPPGHRRAVTVHVPVGNCTVRGRLRWADGRPCRGTIWAGGIVGPRCSVPVATDAEGRFVITGLGRGWQRFSAGISHWHVANVGGLRLPVDTDVTFWVGESGWGVGGRVLDDATGRPVAGALVVAGSFWSGAASTRTDEEGAFRCFSVGGYNAELTVLAEGYSPFVVNQPGEVPDLVIRLHRDSAVFGRVLDAATRAPVGGIPVFAQPAGGDGPATFVRGVTDADGHYRLKGVPAGTLTLLACGRGRISRGAADRGTGIGHPLLVTAPPAGEVRADLFVVPTVAIAGQVVDHRGEPVAGALVRATGEADVPTAMRRSAEPAVLTRPDGRFRLSGVAPHVRYRLSASDGGDRSVRLPELLVPAAGWTGIEIRLPEILVVTATVTDAVTGSPIEGADVQTGADADELWGKTQGRTNGEGRAVLRIERGEGGVARTDHPEYEDDRNWTPVAADGSVELVLTRGAEVTGVVRFEDGTPATKGVVEWEEEWRTETHTLSETHSNPIASDGTFRIGGLRDMKYAILARVSSGGASWVGRIEVRAGTTNAEIRLERVTPSSGEERIPVLVLDPDGRPVPAGHVRTTPGFGHWPESEGNLHDGRAFLNGPREQLERIEVFALRDAIGRPLPWGATRVTEIPAGNEEIVIRLSEGWSIAGRVVDDVGAGLRGVRVRAVALGDWIERVHATSLTDETGSFLLRGLADARHRLDVPVVEGFARAESTVARAGAADVVLRLSPGRAVELRFVDPDGRPVRGADVTLLTGDGGTEVDERTTGWNGLVRLTGLPLAGRLTLDAERPGSRHDLLKIRIENWAPESGTLRFSRSHGLRGSVVDGTGVGVSGCRVTLVDAAGREHHSYTHSFGAFRFEDLPEGKVRLRAAVVGVEPDGPESEEIVVSAGAEDVRIPIDPGPFIAVRVMASAEEREYLHVRLYRPGESEERAFAEHSLDESGRTVFRSLTATRKYTLWVGPSRSGKCFFREGIPPGSEELVVRLLPGLTITGRVAMPGGKDAEGAWIRITREGIAAYEDETGAGGRFSFKGFPSGTYEVFAWADIDGVEYTARGRVEAGGSVELEMRR